MTDAVRAKVGDIIKTAVNAAHPTVPVVFENQKWTQPKGAPWVHVALSPNKSVRKDIGASTIWRHMGVVVINVMVPEDTGTKLLHDICDTVFYAVADQSHAVGADGYVKLCHGERRNRGVVNGWFAYNIQVEYYQDVAAP